MPLREVSCRRLNTSAEPPQELKIAPAFEDPALVESVAMRTLDEHSRRFWKQLMKPALPKPSFVKLMVFRLSRTSIRLMLDEESPDFRYYRERGWFDSDYFYPPRRAEVGGRPSLRFRRCEDGEV